VTVLDEETGQPVPCRVHFRSPEGIPFQPHGHHDHLLSDMETWHIDVGGDVRLGHTTYAYIDGTCEGWLPRGEVLVDVARGFEYEPLHTTVTIQPGQRKLTLRLKRCVNMNAERWFSGDSHVHFLSTQGAHLEAQGEDLNVVNLLQSQWGHLFTNTEDFVGRPVATPDGRTIVYTSQENRQHMLGHLILLGLKRPVMPWCSDGPSEAELGGTLETTLSHWADACHAQGGTVILPHFPNPNGEPAALVATGRADAVEMLQHNMYMHHEYYRYLNAGYRLPLVGGTDKMTSDVPVGIYRTYVHIPAEEPFSYENWCKNLRLGRTVLSGGPILRFTVEGASIGDTLQLPGNGGVVEVEAVAESIFPIHTLEIVQEGRVVAAAEERQGTRRLHLKAQLPVERHTWLAARVGGPDYTQPLLHHDGWSRGVMAHTSPIYVAVGEKWWMFEPETAQYMLTLLEGGRAYIRQRSRQHPPGTVTHHHGEEDHLHFLDRPFREAIEAIHRRMHERNGA
ncbi:MAG: CehA/McbA family metallohydrolase, partial [Chloroflexota bacterium]|nr:CehA/McbA family metallohydrolase [Chloroflexota bacterium]